MRSAQATSRSATNPKEDQEMAIPNFAQRIKAAVEKRIVRGADSSETYEITVTQGSEAQKTRVGLGQVDATVKCSTFVEPEREKVMRPADVLDVNAPALAADAVVKIGER